MNLQREMTLSKLLRTSQEVQFHNTHTLIHGIYDDNGLEGMIICDDWDTIDGMEILISRLSFYEIRSRMNSHRNCKPFLRWIENKKLEYIQEMIDIGDFNTCKSLIINDSIPVS